MSFISSAQAYIVYKAIKFSDILLDLIEFTGFGSQRKCSICSWQGLRFRSFGQRFDSLCPRCNTRERHRLIYEYLQRKSFFNDNTDILYFAPVKGIVKYLRGKNHVNLITTDIDRELIDVRSDITELPFDDATFD